MRRAVAYGVLALLVLVPSFAAAAELKRGMPFPLSTGVAPTLSAIEVHNVTSDNSVDVAVILDAPRAAVDDPAAELLEFGEFCLRYGRSILELATAPEQRQKLNAMAVFYRAKVAGSANRYQDRGFVFSVRDGGCALSEPYPAALKDEAKRRAAIQS